MKELQQDNGKKLLNFYFLNNDHTYMPCKVWHWVHQFSSMDRRVAEDIINGYRISTVWLGINYNYFEGPPHLFETMIFKDDNSDDYFDRYTTWDEAFAGHQKAIEWIKQRECL